MVVMVGVGGGWRGVGEWEYAISYDDCVVFATLYEMDKLLLSLWNQELLNA